MNQLGTSAHPVQVHCFLPVRVKNNKTPRLQTTKTPMAHPFASMVALLFFLVWVYDMLFLNETNHGRSGAQQFATIAWKWPTKEHQAIPSVPSRNYLLPKSRVQLPSERSEKHPQPWFGTPFG